MGWSLLLIAVVVLLVHWGNSTQDDSDKSSRERSGLKIFTDHRTGLQYLRGGLFGGITPRLGINGEHLRKQDDK